MRTSDVDRGEPSLWEIQEGLNQLMLEFHDRFLKSMPASDPKMEPMWIWWQRLQRLTERSRLLPREILRKEEGRS